MTIRREEMLFIVVIKKYEKTVIDRFSIGNMTEDNHGTGAQ